MDHAAPPEPEHDRSAPTDATSAGSSAILFDSVQAELRCLAGVIFAEQKVSHTLQPTALVNEVWLKLANTDSASNKAHYLALAAKAMRQILTDHARRKTRQKRGGDAMRMTLDDSTFVSVGGDIGLVEFSDALERLESMNQRHAQVAEMRLLGSLTVEEIANILNISEGTVKRDWQAARLWLISELCG